MGAHLQAPPGLSIASHVHPNTGEPDQPTKGDASAPARSRETALEQQEACRRSPLGFATWIEGSQHLHCERDEQDRDHNRREDL